MNEAINKLLSIESNLKNTLTDYQLGKISEDQFKDKLFSASYNLKQISWELRDRPGTITLLSPPHVQQAISTAIDLLSNLTYEKPGEVHPQILEKLSVLDNVYQKLREDASRYIDSSKYPTHCARPYPGKSRNLVINDVAQCLHQIALLVKEVESSKKPSELVEFGLCKVYVPENKKHLIDNIYNVLEDPNSYYSLPEDIAKDPLVKGAFICSVWDKGVRAVYGLDYIELEGGDLTLLDEYAFLPVSLKDIEALHGIVTEHKTYLRVGSQYGHYTEYDPNTDELTYYDPDPDVREVFEKLMEPSTGVLECQNVEVGNYLSHVKCKLNLNYFYENDRGLFEEGLLLASVTGLDYRIGYKPVLDQMSRAFKHREDINKNMFYDVLRSIETKFVGIDNEKRKELNYDINKRLVDIFS